MANIDRRKFLESLLAVSAAAASPAAETPPHATDVHHHIYDSRFPPDPTATLRPPDATVDDYLVLQKQLRLTRHVAIQPSTYGTDNRCLLAALHRFGKAARGIAVVDTTVSNAELKKLNASGIRGLRFNLVQAGATNPQMIEPLSKRIASFGWHIQVNASTEQILANTAIWNRLPVPVVFDHFGHATDKQSPVFVLLCDLMQKDKAWVKLSGVETISKVGPPTYSDGSAVAEAFLKEAPDRLLWGSNWPHSTSKVKPDDSLLFSLVPQWTNSPQLLNKILVENPQKLFGFH
jgi:predicted TIM-barrel fold metal-dependent hydrolase